MFPQVTVEKCSICNSYVILTKMSEHLKNHSQDHELAVPQKLKKYKPNPLFDSLSDETSQDYELVPRPQQLKKYKPNPLFDSLSDETSQDHELAVPQKLKKYKPTTSFGNLSTETSQDQELLPQQLEHSKAKPTTLFNNLSDETSTNEKRVKNWTKSETLFLIEAYENNILIFESNSKKNRLGWIQVSKDLKKKQIEYTEDQCQGKFKYLLLCYKKKLDNRHETGSAVYEFEFFNELDELFGRKPNIRPKHLASSSRIYNGIKENCGIFDEDNVSSPKHVSNITPPELKKQKKNTSVHEASIQKRHDEKMAMSQLALDTYKTYMDKLLEKL
ncbi:unnamed protein product [Macrosiphum euphorbiae]|uniref:Myb/SANT-like DNA-binding domain-containing protein n=1 Tax=Macrosiphum euphorbiae TaxID=13131 RepID=A0AAV0WDR3_9HEMI|nr:unnamed protein product [Macrosiphum euphorbiae]